MPETDQPLEDEVLKRILRAPSKPADTDELQPRDSSRQGARATNGLTNANV